MAGQAPSRRQLLQALACASIASTAPGFARWSFAFAEPQTAPHHHHPTTPAPHRSTVYQPQFFTPPEYHTITLLAELILPSTAATPAHPAPKSAHHTPDPATAGATDAGVAEFIDFMVTHDTTLQGNFRPGLAWLDTAAQRASTAQPSTFAALSPAQQNALLERLAYKRNFRPDDKPGQDFFALMRKYTVMGFYTSRIGLESLDYPGLRFYAESPSVPNDGSLAKLGVQA